MAIPINDFVMSEELSTEMDEIYRKYYPNILNLIRIKIGNLQDAEDITTEIFIKIARFIHTFNDDLALFPTWVYNVSMSVLRDWLRTNHQKKYPLTSTFIDKDGNQTFNFKSFEKTDDLVLKSEINERIIKAFRNLKSNYRKIAILFFIRDLNYNEISIELNLPIGTVKGMISRCRKMLKTELNDLYKIRETIK
jgi:RNA polymerase sigma-70 factor (ECF subfamily)